jgi:uncharacterized membrane protein (DUF485 family)
MDPLQRTALRLFAVYLVLYAGFMAVSAFFPAIMGATPVAGLPLSIVFGLGLIGVAFVLAALYLRAAR